MIQIWEDINLTTTVTQEDLIQSTISNECARLNISKPKLLNGDQSDRYVYARYRIAKQLYPVVKNQSIIANALNRERSAVSYWLNDYEPIE